MNPFKSVAIVGIGQTKIGRIPGSSSVSLQAEAGRLALKDAGISKGEVDGVLSFCGYSRGIATHSALVAEYLGIRPSFVTDLDCSGLVTAMTALFTAASAIKAGMCKIALCAFGENGLSSRSVGVRGRPIGLSRGTEEWEEPYGCLSMATPYAMLASQHMHKYGTTSEQLGAVAVSARKHASMNPTAQMQQPITLEDHRRSPMVSYPLRRLDCSLISDGAGAIVIARVDRAAQLRQTPVSILAFAMKSTHRNISQAPPLGELAIKEVGKEVFKRTGLTLTDVDVAEVYDAFTISTILAIEGLGFCKEGEGGAYVSKGLLELGNGIPVNTHGGLLSHGHVGGIFHLTEAVEQLRGNCGQRQVAGAEVALVFGNGGVFTVCGAMVLSRGSE